LQKLALKKKYMRGKRTAQDDCRLGKGVGPEKVRRIVCGESQGASAAGVGEEGKPLGRFPIGTGLETHRKKLIEGGQQDGGGSRQNSKQENVGLVSPAPGSATEMG